MVETLKAITNNTVIPIGLVISIAMAFYFLGQLSQRVTAVEQAGAVFARKDDITWIRDDIREIKEILKPFNYEVR